MPAYQKSNESSKWEQNISHIIFYLATIWRRGSKRFLFKNFSSDCCGVIDEADLQIPVFYLVIHLSAMNLLWTADNANWAIYIQIELEFNYVKRTKRNHIQLSETDVNRFNPKTNFFCEQICFYSDELC